MCMICLFTCTAAWGQDVALKTNGLFWLTTTPNVGVEVALSPKYTLELAGAYNPWTFKDDKKMRFWLVQPELKYWFCEKFEGHFVSVHLHGAQYYGGLQGRNAMDGYLDRGRLHLRIRLDSFPSLEPGGRIGIGYAACGTRRVPGPFARNATRTRRRTTRPHKGCHLIDLHFLKVELT